MPPIPSRYAKNRFIVRPPSDGSGLKTRSMWLAEALGGRWSRRDHGYLLAPTRAKAFEILDAAGFDASRKFFGYDKTPYTFTLREGPELSLKQALIQVKAKEVKQLQTHEA